MRKPVLLAIAAATLLAAPLAYAQYRPPEDRDGGNPMEDFFRNMDRDNVNPILSCDTRKRLNRRGEIVWIRLECRAVGYAGR